ncbi:hypothetical protein BHE74_00015184 [Ensete ventricosum]|nr:hypothetical protein BHE74_00015184 [Ensete ventricosum]
MTDQQLSGKRLGLSPSNHDVNDENCQMEHCAAKRMRKPTKRYIEELSELETRECTAKSYSCMKISEYSHFPSKRQIKPVCDGKTQRRIFSTRHVSVGEFSFEVPYVLRTTTRRPRKNFVDLMEYYPATISHMVKTAVMIPALEEGKGNGSRSREIVSVPVQILQQVNQYSAAGEGDVKMNTKTLNREEDLDLDDKGLDANGDTTYGYANTRPAPKASARRKHHRAWTLCEVRKLVDGVAKYGAGRWSEIRRLAFASYSYRTSVDLKAKNLSKQTTVPIPTSILSQVRELANDIDVSKSGANARWKVAGGAEEKDGKENDPFGEYRDLLVRIEMADFEPAAHVEAAEISALLSCLRLDDMRKTVRHA